jgi:hypothetical protein
MQLRLPSATADVVRVPGKDVTPKILEKNVGS